VPHTAAALVAAFVPRGPWRASTNGRLSPEASRQLSAGRAFK
jgi:hypothetical protein